MKNTNTALRMRSAAKWETIALSSPYFQYNQPNSMPIIPFKMSALETVTISTGMPMTTMLEM